MSTPAVPGAVAANNDVLTVGCWAEHEDGSLIFVEGVEAGSVVFSIFDIAVDPPVEYRDSMMEEDFKSRFSWPNKDELRWTWHDKTPFDWSRVMHNFPAGVKFPSVDIQMSAAQRVAESLNLKAQDIIQRAHITSGQQAATGIMQRLGKAIALLKR